MIRTSYFDSALLQRLSGNDLLTDFFVHAIYQQKKDSRYIIFPKGQNKNSPFWASFLLFYYLGTKILHPLSIPYTCFYNRLIHFFYFFYFFTIYLLNIYKPEIPP
jgi:hypothetical protein